MTVRHKIRGYDRRTDELVEEHDLPAACLDRIRPLVSAGRDDPDLVAVYPLDAAAIQAIVALLPVRLDLDRYDFFLDADASWETIRAAKAKVAV